MKRMIIACIYVLLVLVCGWLFCGYVFYYNTGNNHYQKMNYEEAVKSYEAALEANPPDGRECPIRINLALAMLKTLGDDYAEQDNIQNSIVTLKKAREVLLVDDCATEDGKGHNEAAERLKYEIEKIIEELEAQAEDGDDSDDGNQEDNQTQNEEDELEKSIKEELQRIQSNSYQERQEQLQFMEEFDMEINFDMEALIW